MSRGRGIGIAAGAVTGALGVLNTVRVLAEHATISRARRRPDPTAEIAIGEFPADRHYTVSATDGTPLYVEETGPTDAPVVVVFAHGYTNNRGAWHFQQAALSRVEDPRMRLVLFDQRSHGRSGRSAASDCTVDQLGSDLEQVIRAATRNDERVILVGHSMGGMTIMALADVAPGLFGSKVDGVALLSTSAGNVISLTRRRLPSSLAERTIPVIAKGAQVAPKTVERSRRLVANALWLAIRRYSFGERPAPASLADFVDRMIAATPADVIADFYSTIAGHDKVYALPALSACEVLILCGDADRMTPIKHSEVLAAELPKAELRVISGAGHMAMMEEPELVNAHLLAFIRRVVAKRSKRRKKSA